MGFFQGLIDVIRGKKDNTQRVRAEAAAAAKVQGRELGAFGHRLRTSGVSFQDVLSGKEGAAGGYSGQGLLERFFGGDTQRRVDFINETQKLRDKGGKSAVAQTSSRVNKAGQSSKPFENGGLLSKKKSRGLNILG